MSDKDDKRLNLKQGLSTINSDCQQLTVIVNNYSEVTTAHRYDNTLILKRVKSSKDQKRN
jgi:hypothetical protein